MTQTSAMSRSAGSFNRHVGYSLVLLAALGCAFAVYVVSEKSIDTANAQRLESLRLVDELRQSSDDLTRMVRLYVATGDVRHKQNFQQILDIRDGRQARPERYHGVYWDLVSAAGVPPRPETTTRVALLDLMRAARFTEEEFDVLARAKAVSDALSRTELAAMALRESQGSDAAASHARAIAMVHDAHYLAAKAAIMQPIDEFHLLMAQRTDLAVARAERNALVTRAVFIGIALALMLMIYRTSRVLRSVLGGSVDLVEAQIARIGSGDFSVPLMAGEVQRDSVLARLAETHARLGHVDGERNAALRALERLNRDLRLLSDCNMTLVRAEDESRLLAEVCRICVATGGYAMAWVGYAIDDPAHSVQRMASSGDDAGYLEEVEVSWADGPSGQGPTGQAIRSGQPAVNQDVLTNPVMRRWREAAVERGFLASVALPLVSDGQVLGALNLYAREAEAFDPVELSLLMELANDLAYGIVVLRTRSEHAAAKEKLAFLAHFDPLTHLPNRTLLRDRFDQATLSARAGPDGGVALVYVDLDRFTQINDSLGYAAGDHVIVRVVERLQQCTPATATISRLTGDEFVVLLHGGVEVPTVAALADAIRTFLGEPIKIEGNVVNLSCSIGIGLFPGDGDDFDTLLKHAHTAVESAKEAGRDACRFFSSEMNAGLVEQIRLTGGLTNALRNREFLLHYQPQIELRSGRIVGAEALLRWQHPVDGLLAPGKFIALAERSGHILPIGEWVLGEACRQARAWLDRDPAAPAVAVNLSALQFKRGNVFELVSLALEASGLPADRLELELTESILLQDVVSTMQTLQDLKALGVKLSIDDFGTGYSSLSYLKRLAVDKIKIDQTFVGDMLVDADGASIVKAIIQLGHNLNLTVVAEGVETAAQQSTLRDSGCDEVQGYLISRPLEPRRFEAFMDAWIAADALAAQAVGSAAAQALLIR